MAILAVVLVIFAFPWKADGSATFSATNPTLDSIYPENSTSIAFTPSQGSIALTGPSPGEARVDLLHTLYPFRLNTTATVEEQSGPLPSAWRSVSVTAPVPAGGRAFDLYFGAWNGTSVDLASVVVSDASSPGTVLFEQNFSNSTVGWQLSPYARFGTFGSPPKGAIQATTLGSSVGDANMLNATPIPAGVRSVTVLGEVRFNGEPGPFHLTVDVLNSSFQHLAYLANWPSWAAFSVPPRPLDLFFWDAALPYSFDVVFAPTNGTAGTVDIEYQVGGTPQRTEAVGTYDVGQPVGILLRWSPGANVTISFTFAGRAPYHWSSDSFESAPGVTTLVDYPQNTVSASSESAVDFASLAVVSNATYLFEGSGTFTSLTAGYAPAVAGTAAAFVVVGLFGPEWWPSAKRLLRSLSELRRRRGARGWVGALRANWAISGALGALLSFYAYLAYSFGGHPYDNWTFKVWVYASQVGGIHGLYVQPEFVGDAVVRGATVPWSTPGFGYGPGCAELFLGLSRILPPLTAFPSVASLDASVAVSAEIKWLLALGTIAAGLALYLWVRRSTGRTDLGTVAFLLLVVNPAVAFDSAVWGETDSVLYLLFVLFAIAAVYRPTWAMVVAGLAIGFKETGPILLFPAALLVLAPGVATVDRLRRVAAAGATLLLVTVPVLWAGLLPSVLLSPYAGLFSNFVAGSSQVHPFVSPETYTVWTLFTGFSGGNGLRRMMLPSSTALLPGLSYSLLGTAAFALAWLGMFAATRSAGRTRSPLFWLLTTSFSALIFTALLTGTGSRYYTLALPGLSGALVLAWPAASKMARRMLAFAYAIPTAISFWTMMGLFTVIMGREVPDIRGLGLAYNPVSQFVARGYANGAVVTLGSLGAMAAVVLIAILLLRAARGEGQNPPVAPVPVAPQGRGPADSREGSGEAETATGVP
ncbi:MAG TPA: hypothetical protein VGS23_05810 [Thermoplasmata archaeon]|nr:hypothetical protein [Thermoplasmata archaeon]